MGSDYGNGASVALAMLNEFMPVSAETDRFIPVNNYLAKQIQEDQIVSDQLDMPWAENTNSRYEMTLD